MVPHSEAQLQEKFRTIEALIAGAWVKERRLDGTPLEHLRARLEALKQQNPSTEIQFSIPDVWSRRLFAALCRRYGLQPYRYSRQKRTTVVVTLPRRFVDDVLWPAFQQLDMALAIFLKEGAQRAIHDEIHVDSSEPTEVVALPPEHAGRQ